MSKNHFSRITLSEIFFINDFTNPLDIYKKKNIPLAFKNIFKIEDEKKEESKEIKPKVNHLEEFLECTR